MRLGKVVFAIVLGCCATAQAEENVFVDLSVLDSLNGAYMAPREPLFPVLPKQEKKISRAINKPVVKKQTPAKVKPAPVKVSAPKAVKPAEELPAPKEPEIVVVDVESAESVHPTPVQPVQSAPIQQAESSASEPVAEAPLAEPVTSKAENIQTDVVYPQENIANEAVKPLEESPKAPSDAVADLKEADKAEIAAENQPEQNKEESAEHLPELLISENSAAEQSVAVPELSSEDRSIVFADGKDELSPEQMAKIDDIIGRFKDVNANKIAIYSYNLDDGVDSFRKKRVSLNRAVEIRSYLIKQGYKNFSIKVININSGSDKINTVELEEI